ncbi:MAG: hypothetical protein OXR68_05160 [Alphaproteobacteria bacterium]|nr:hypothetical protein [Alphaproteobacteria bacterium]MDD9919992.1 hypothetical protein [Alphaproteobacteria bacterium]
MKTWLVLTIAILCLVSTAALAEPNVPMIEDTKDVILEIIRDVLAVVVEFIGDILDEFVRAIRDLIGGGGKK